MAFGLAAVVTLAAGDHAAADRSRRRAVARRHDHRRGDGALGLPAGAVGYVRAAQDNRSLPSKRFIPSRRRPSGSRTQRDERVALRDRRDPARDRADPRRDERNHWRDPGSAAARSPAAAGEGRREGSGDRKGEEHHAFGRARRAYDAAQRARGAGNHLAWYATEHPIRIAITAGVVTWWMLRGRGRTAGAVVRRVRHVVGLRRVRDRREHRRSRPRRRVASTARETVGEYASTVRQAVGSAASTARETAGEYAASARDTVNEYAHRRPRRRGARRTGSARGRHRDDLGRRLGPRQSARGRRRRGGGRRGHRPRDAPRPNTRIAPWARRATRRWRRRGTSPTT